MGIYDLAAKQILIEMADILPGLVEVLEEIKDDFDGRYGTQLTNAIVNIEKAREQILLCVENMNRQKGQKND
jgi:hypothetical protein